MGPKGVAALLHLAKMQEFIDNYPPDNLKKEFTFNSVAGVQQALWEMAGKRGARVFATRAGEQTFMGGLSMFKSVAAAAQVAMRVGSLDAKMKIGMEFFSKLFHQISDQKIVLDEDEKHYYWIHKVCPICWGRHAEEPVCHLAIGVLQAAGGWMSDGKKFRIKETECKAKGDRNCKFAIEKVPVE